MSSIMRTGRAPRDFSRYAAASAAALAAATAAKAQFTGSYALTPPGAGTFTDGASAGTFGNWTGTQTGTSTLTTSSGADLVLSTSSASLTHGTLTFLTTAAAAGNVSFNYDTLRADGSGTEEFFYTSDGTTFTLITGSSVTGGSQNFSVANGATFGFRVAATYTGMLSSMQATISNFSAPSAIPEPGATTLLAGVASLGFVGLMGTRAARRRAAAAAEKNAV